MSNNYHNPQPWFTFYEWQENRYNVGYFQSFGRLAPFFRGNGSLKYGLLMLIPGFTALIFISLIPFYSPIINLEPLYIAETYFNFTFLLLYTFSGIEMVYRNLPFTPKGPVIVEDPSYNFEPFLLITGE